MLIVAKLRRASSPSMQEPTFWRRHTVEDINRREFLDTSKRAVVVLADMPIVASSASACGPSSPQASANGRVRLLPSLAQIRPRQCLER